MIHLTAEKARTRPGLSTAKAQVRMLMLSGKLVPWGATVEGVPWWRWPQV
ncbi:hypothetical protein [Streptomyces sp. NPDC021562]